MNTLAVEVEASSTYITSRELLLKFPSGAAYTTARTCLGGDRILEWDTHVERTAKSISLLEEETDVNDTNHNTLSNRSILRPRLNNSVQAAIRHHRQQQHDDDNATNELKITIVVNIPKDTMYCHVTQLPLIPAAPICVEIRGNPRSNASAKDASWVTNRAPLEDLLQQAQHGNNMHEFLLMDHALLYEGSQTNFYAIHKNGTVYTAQDGVLHGTIRKLLLQVCQEHDIPVILEPPSLKQVEDWQGALLSSTSRLALPVDALYLPKESQPSRYPQDLIRTFDYSSSNACLTKQLQQLVSEKVVMCSTPIFTT